MKAALRRTGLRPPQDLGLFNANNEALLVHTHSMSEIRKLQARYIWGRAGWALLAGTWGWWLQGWFWKPNRLMWRSHWVTKETCWSPQCFPRNKWWCFMSWLHVRPSVLWVPAPWKRISNGEMGHWSVPGGTPKQSLVRAVPRPLSWWTSRNTPRNCSSSRRVCGFPWRCRKHVGLVHKDQTVRYVEQ